ncbi:MAG: hypothetical protein C6H99_06080 [Epsilonproteobacteria bacterium]|nr:hypothetical protein [Campylobacterota bacterium]NPA65170.1 energy transducer TonB [Campylobacterota bacterium]
MKRSFFIALGLYMALFASLALLYEAPKPRKSRSISLRSIAIKKAPSCACKPCSCLNCTAHPKKLEKPPKPPAPKPQEVVQKSPTTPPKKPKKIPIKKEPTKISKKIKRPPKRVKKIKKSPKKIKKTSQKPKKTQKKIKRVKKTQRAHKKELQKPSKKISHAPLLASSTSSAPAQSKTAHSPSVTPPTATSGAAQRPVSYQQRYTDRFLGRIREAILRHLRYPRIARKTKKEGVVHVGFTLLPSRKLSDLRIVQSSGHKILDRAALKCVKRASKEFPAPKEPVKLRIPIEFRLR